MCSGSNRNASRNASQAKTKAYPKQARWFGEEQKIAAPAKKSWWSSQISKMQTKKTEGQQTSGMARLKKGMNQINRRD